jgi:hypothetical protein
MGEHADHAQLAASIAGLLGGVAMAAVLLAYSGAAGAGLLVPFDRIGSFWQVSVFSVTPSFRVPLGVASHFAIAFGMGGPMGWAVDRTTSVASRLLIGLGSGIAVWAIVTFGVVPSLNEELRVWVADQTGLLWLGAHLAWGLVTGAATPVFDRLIRGPAS